MAAPIELSRAQLLIILDWAGKYIQPAEIAKPISVRPGSSLEDLAADRQVEVKAAGALATTLYRGQIDNRA